MIPIAGRPDRILASSDKRPSTHTPCPAGRHETSKKICSNCIKGRSSHPSTINSTFCLLSLTAVDLIFLSSYTHKRQSANTLFATQKRTHAEHFAP